MKLNDQLSADIASNDDAIKMVTNAVAATVQTLNIAHNEFWAGGTDSLLAKLNRIGAEKIGVLFTSRDQIGAACNEYLDTVESAAPRAIVGVRGRTDIALVDGQFVVVQTPEQ